MAKNSSLQRAKDAKNDEFYTQLADVEKELQHYKQHFKDKIVLCNCDDPTWSAFWKYFHLNFAKLGLKKLISTHYDKNEPTYKMEYTGGNDNDIGFGVKTPLEGNGDFRNAECTEFLKQVDIVVTNGPFSLFREYVAQLMEYGKRFLIVGNMNALNYKNFFPLLKDNKVWLGCSSGSKEYMTTEEYARKNPSKAYQRGGKWYTKLGNTCWFTNLDHEKRHQTIPLDLGYTYYGHEDMYPKYDNYDAINIDKVNEIPVDYEGVMGVPITFMDRYCPEQFLILGLAGGTGWNCQNDVQTIKEYFDAKQHNPNGTIGSGGKVNTGAALLLDKKPDDIYYTASNAVGYLIKTYGRILIRRKAE